MADRIGPPPIDNTSKEPDDDNDLFADAIERSYVDVDMSSNHASQDLSGSEITKQEILHIEDCKSKIEQSTDKEQNNKLASSPVSDVMQESRDSPEPFCHVLDNNETTSAISALDSSPHSSAVGVKCTNKIVENGDQAETNYEISITVAEPQKVGEGMSAYMLFYVTTKTTNPAFFKSEMTVPRRFSDFLGINARLSEHHIPNGIIVPPAPEKSVLGMTKIKISKEESRSAEFVETRRAALERYLNRTASHPSLLTDPDFKEFLEKDTELPRSTNTSAFSGAGVMRLLHKVGDTIEKMAFKMDEIDEWFEEKQQQVDALDDQLHKLHASVESLVSHRRELRSSTAVFAKSAAMLGNIEEHMSLSRALSQLAETEEKIELIHKNQADSDFYLMAELLKDYIALIGTVKVVLHERTKSYKTWKDAEAMLGRKRENRTKFSMQNKHEKVALADREIAEYEERVENGQKAFKTLSGVIKEEMARFERYRIEDFKSNVLKYIEALAGSQKKLITCWETFLPEVKAIA